MECTPSITSLLYCDVCSLQSLTEEAHRSHLLGKRHWTNQKLKDEAMRSVYVSRLPLDTTKEELENIFTSFGTIQKIILDAKGTYAIVEFSSVDIALSVLRNEQPLQLRNSLLKTRPRDYRPRINKKHSTKSDNSMEDETSPQTTEETDPITALRDKLALDDDQISSVLSNPTIDGQIRSLVSHLHLPPSSLSAYHGLLHRLKIYFSAVFPVCQVMPFGSIVTGLATPTSDMDVTLLTTWTAEDQKSLGMDLLELDLEQPLETQTGIEEMETSGPTMPIATPTTPSAKSHEGFSLPSNVKCAGSHGDIDNWPMEYKEALRIISGVEGFSKILAISTARCPIVRFTDSHTGITCDVSINNRLGLYNSKLLKSYLKFEPRLVPILFVLRLWLRLSLPDVRLSNYALILMVIHCLQRSVPPILPSLQHQGPWPRNMEWFGTNAGFTGQVMADITQSIVDRWSFKLIRHESLLPSTDNKTLAELLHHFFHYYSSLFPFSTHSIGIHTHPNTILTKDEADSFATHNAPPTLPHKYRVFKVSCLTIQDPLELTHNVAKNISPRLLNVMKSTMATACGTMETLLQSSTELCGGGYSNSILSLFGKQPPVKQSKTRHILNFSRKAVSNVFKKVPSEADLVDLKMVSMSCYLKERLALVILKSLVWLLEQDLGFICIPSMSDDKSNPFGNSVVQQETPHHPLNTASFSLIKPVQPVYPVKRQRNDDSGGELEEVMAEIVSIDASEEKRIKSDSTDNDRSSITSLIETHSLLSDHRVYPSSVTCSTSVNTWVNRRKARRQEGSGDCISQATPIGPPILIFTMSCVPIQDDTVPDSDHNDGDASTIVSIELSIGDNTHMLDEFHTFFAYFKKFVLL